jgi:hypothetical protein
MDEWTHQLSEGWNARRKGKIHEQSPEAKAAMERYWEQVKNEPQNLKQTTQRQMTPDDVINLITERGRRYKSVSGARDGVFELSPEERRLFGILILYFTGNPAFEKYGDGYSLSKCLYISGPVGCGKTTAIMLLASTPGAIHDFSMNKCVEDIAENGWGDGITIAPYKIRDIVAAQRIEDSYKEHGEDGLHRYLAGREMVIDDFGNEEFSAKHFGNPKNVLEFIMNRRHQVWHGGGKRTHITTNVMSGDDIERLYGGRLRSRFREMFNFIDWVGEDKRK